MLHLLIGTDWTANRDEILHRIGRDVKDRKGNRILLVPELVSHEMERQLCTWAGDTASRYAEVLSFTRLGRRVCEYMGCGSLEALDKGGRVVAMAAAARQLHSRLKAYAAVETKPEFLTGLIEAVDEFKRGCISAEDLRAAAQSAEGSLAQKLEELSLLLESYDALCSQGKRDPRDQENLLLEQMELGDFGENHVFYIDGFPDFTRQHLAILEHLIRTSPDVTIAINCDSVDSSMLAFEKPGDTASQIIRCAKHAGVEVQIERINPHPMPMNSLREHLYQGPISEGELKDRVRVFRAETVDQECLAAAERIQELVRQGCRYRDITVVCADLPGYQNMVRLAFHRCGIPEYLSGTEDILQKSVISTVLSAMEAALGGFEQRSVLRYLRSVLSPVEPDLCDFVENYAVIWGIRGKKWMEIWKNHPDGLSGVWDEDSEKLLSEMESARAMAMEPLARLAKGFADARSMRQQVEVLYDFLEEICLEERLDGLAREMDDLGDNRSAQILNQLWEILLGALEQLYDVLGNTYWDAETFTRLFQLLLSQYDVGTIPPVLDAVQVGAISAQRLHQQKHLIVLGAQEGNLPGYSGSVGILTDQERVTLRELGVPLTGGNLEGIQAEFAEIYGVFCGATDSITVYSSGGQPSFVYRRLARMAGGEEPVRVDLATGKGNPYDAGAYLARWNDRDKAIKLGLGDAYDQVLACRDYDLGTITRENVHSIYGRTLTLSASQIDRQAECRLSYFLKYGLRAKERKEATVDPAEFGTYVHAVLENTARTIKDLGGFQKVSLEQTQAIAEKFSDEYAAEHFAQLDSERVTYLFRRNTQELGMVVRELWEELQESQFQPEDFEVNFGSGEGLPPIAFRGRDMSAILRGFVDRVDTWVQGKSSYYRIVDYKTGRKDFDYCDVFNGVGLQMLLYLFALQESGNGVVGDNPIPAGVQYFPARAPYVSADGRLTEEDAKQQRGKDWKRKGLLLKDEQVLLAMEPSENPKRLCYTTRKDGTLVGDLADRDQLKQLKAYVFKVLGKMVDEIASGNVEANPYTRGTSHSACDYCPYGAVCHKDHVEGRRNYKTMKPERFWEEIGKELGTNG